jgi:hypothetical protein
MKFAILILAAAAVRTNIRPAVETARAAARRIPASTATIRAGTTTLPDTQSEVEGARHGAPAGSLRSRPDPCRAPSRPPTLSCCSTARTFPLGARRPGRPNPGPKWKVENGYIEIVPKTGRLITKESSAIASSASNG